MKHFIVIIPFFILACQTPTPKEQTIVDNSTCDCKELHHNTDYNVLHQGNPREPYTGTCYDYYLGGNLKKISPILGGKLEGVKKIYHKNGALKSSTDYEVGLMTGDYKVFNENGQLVYHGRFKRNDLIKVVFPLGN